jgi:uncharacterized membrane protein YkvA (DUF1232 family)
MSGGGYEKYGGHYSEDGLWRKLTEIPVSIGRSVAMQALLLYALLTDGNVPLWAKALIVGVLGYLILPIDAIPDVIPVIGYTDDAAAMAFVLHQLSEYVTPAIRERAESLLPGRFRK